MGCCNAKKKPEKTGKTKKSSSRRSNDHSPDSLKSRSPSYEELHYKRARKRRPNGDDAYSETYIKCKDGSPTVHVHFCPNGQNPFEQAANFYNTYQAPIAQDSAYYGRPPSSPPPLEVSPSEKFTPGALRSVLNQATYPSSNEKVGSGSSKSSVVEQSEDQKEGTGPILTDGR